MRCPCHLHAVGVGAEEQGEVLLRLHHGQFLLVLVVGGRAGVVNLLFRVLFDDRHDLLAARQVGGLLGLVKIPVADRTPLVHQIAQARIGLLMDQAGEAHADFGTVVAAEHRAVVDQGHLGSPAAPR